MLTEIQISTSFLKEMVMNNNNLTVAEAYYTAMSEKNVMGMGKHLHPDIHFLGPLAEIKGKEEFLEAAKGFTSFFKTLTIRAKFGSEDQAMLVYDLDFPAPIGKLPTAALLTFQEGLISKIELFCDGRPFEREKA